MNHVDIIRIICIFSKGSGIFSRKEVVWVLTNFELITIFEILCHDTCTLLMLVSHYVKQNMFYSKYTVYDKL